MTLFQTTTLYNCAPEVTLEYDPGSEQYHGRVVSRTGVYEMVGPDKNSVMYQIDGVLREEHAQLLRSIEQDKEQSQSQSQSQTQTQTQSRSQSRADSSMLSSAAMTVASSSVATLIPHFGVAATVAEGLHMLWGYASGRPKKFVAMFAGIKISAPTRKLLKKKMLRLRDAHIAKIMAGVKAQERQRQNIDTMRKASLVAKRIQVKRKKAIARGPQSWEKRVAPERNAGEDWRERTETLKGRIADKKEHARDLWTNR